MSRIVSVISREKGKEVATIEGAGDFVVALREASVIILRGSNADVVRYERQGSDLIIHMKDGSVIRCRDYFVADEEGHHSELVFQDEASELTHITFDSMSEYVVVDSVTLSPIETPLATIEPLLYGSYFDMGLLGTALGILAGGVLIGSQVKKNNETTVETTVEHKVPELLINPFFTVQDNVGQKQGTLQNNEATDDKQPTFTGVAQPGSSIKILNEKGETIASATADQTTGKWSVILPTQSEGSHTYKVVQTVGDGQNAVVTDAGSISLVIVAPDTAAIDDKVAGDDIINATEIKGDLTLSGTSSLADKTELTVSLNGVSYKATVMGGKWSITVPASDASQLADGKYAIEVTGKDTAGNDVKDTHIITVNTVMPTVSVDMFAGDDVLNNAEINVAQMISGRVTNAAAGDIVTIELNGKTYTTVVQSDLTWNITVPAEDVNSLNNGDFTITASVTNSVGNTGEGERDIAVNTQLPRLEIDTVAGDNVINAIELQQALVISGTSTDLAIGTVVIVTINGKDYATSVDNSYSWRVGIPAADVAEFPAGQLVIQAIGYDTAGNPANMIHSVQVDLSPVAISINVIAEDNIINAAEKGLDLQLSGSTLNVEVGQIVTIIVGATTLQTTVAADGGWSVLVPAADLDVLNEGINNIVVNVSNNVGNNASAGQEVTVDTTTPMIVINEIADKDILNAVAVEAELPISGTTYGAEPGQTVTITLAGKTYDNKTYTAIVNKDGTWTLNISPDDLALLADGYFTVTAIVSDKAGNTASADRDLLINTGAPVLTIDTVTADDILNAAESNTGFTFTGSVSHGDANQVVIITLNGQDYSVTADATGKWSLVLTAGQVKDLGEGDITLTANATDTAGNASTTVNHLFVVDTIAPVLTIDNVTADNILNATETASGFTFTGTSDANQAVTVTLNGIEHSVIADATGKWSLVLSATEIAALGQGSISLTANAIDAAGNASAEVSHPFVIDTLAPALTIDNVTADDILNAAESKTGFTFTGTSDANQVVIVTLNGQNHSVTADASGKWSLALTAGQVKDLGEGAITLTANAIDHAGNASTTVNHPFAIDSIAPALTIDNVTADNILNAMETSSGFTFTGTSDANQAVTVTLNGIDHNVTADATGKWSLVLSATEIAALGQGSISLTANATDLAGNASVEVSHPFVIDTLAPVLTIDNVTADDILNAAESKTGFTFTGTSDANQVVIVTLNGQNHSVTADASGKWSLVLTAGQVKDLGEGDITFTANATDTAGNASTTVNHLFVVDTIAPVLTIDNVTADNILNATETASGFTFTGTSDANQAVTVTLNGIEHSVIADATGKWSLVLSATEIAALGQGSISLTANATDLAGNASVEVSHPFVIDTLAPVLTIDNVTADDILNAAESKTGFTLTGTSDANQVVIVTLNGQNHSVTADASGKWSLALTAGQVKDLGEGAITLTANATDHAGNASAAVNHPFAIDSIAPVLTIDNVTADNILNAAETSSGFTFTGTSDVNQAVTVTLNGIDHNVTADANGKWSLALTAAEVIALGQGSISLTANATDAAGNASAEVSHPFVIDTIAPVLTIDNVTADDILNAAESKTGFTLTGTSDANQVVIVTLNGQEHSVTADATGKWSLALTAGQVKDLGEGGMTLTANAIDHAGNASTTVNHPFAIDSIAPALTIDNVTADNILNAMETSSGFTFTGTSDANQAVTVTLNGIDHNVTADATGKWSLVLSATEIAALGQGSISLTANAIDAAGNASAEVSHPFVIDTLAPALTIDNVTADDILNAAESKTGFTFTGTSDANQVVIVTLNGQEHSVTADVTGKWSLALTAGQVKDLGEGAITLTANATDHAGNASTTVNHPFAIDSIAPVLTIDNVTADNILNAAETASGFTFTGTSDANQAVTVTLNGIDHNVTADANGKWSLALTAAEVIALGQGSISLTANATDATGNASAEVSHPFVIDTLAPALTIDNVTADDILNAAESKTGFTFTGTSDANQVVIVTLNGQEHSVTADVTGKWSLALTAGQVKDLGEGAITLTANATDHAGNASTTVNHPFAIDSIAPVLTIDNVTADNILNAAETASGFTFTGTSDANQAVTVTLNGIDHNVTADANGKWSLALTAAEVIALGQGSISLTANATDAAGNASVEVSHPFVIDTLAPVLTIDNVTADDILNAAESKTGFTFTGTSDANQVVIVTLNGQNHSVTADASGKWSLVLTAGQVKDLGEGDITLTANATDTAGNASTTVNHPFAIDSIAPVLTIDNVTADNILNATETASGFTFTGTSDANQAVTVTLNGIDHNVTADANGKWSLVLTAAEVIALGQGSISLTANAIDAAGNASAEVSHPFVIDTLAPALTIDNVTADDILNAAESKTGFTFTGTSDANQVVIVTLNGQEHSVTADVTGKWSLALTAGQVKDLGEGAITLTANATDHAGNASAAVNHPFVIDSIAPVLTIDNVTADNILNAAETASGFTFTGTSDADQVVIVTLNGTNYNVTADATGKWSLVLSATEIAALGQGSISLTANATDAAGNASVEVSHPFVIDTIAPVLTIDNVTADDILNAAESKTGFTLTGTSDANQVVIVTLNGQEHSVTADATGKWSLALTAGQVKDLGEGGMTLTANAIDHAGNASTTVNHPFAVDSIAPVLTIDNVTADNILNAAETASGFTFTGTSDANQAVTVTLNGIDHNVTADANGKWSLVLTAAEVIALGQGSISLTANAIDAAGNASAEVSHPFVIDTLAPALTIDNVTADDILNAAESKTGFTFTGTSDANQVVIVTLNGQEHSVTADVTGKWSLALTAGQVKDLGEGAITLSANAIDHAGNASTTVNHPFAIDSIAPVLTIDNVTADNILNAAETASGFTFTGTSDANQAVTVTLNGIDHNVTADANGKWSLALTAAEVIALGQGSISLTANATDAAGNASVEVSHPFVIDTLAPVLTIDNVTADDILNAAESKTGFTLTGTSDANQAVTVTLNGIDHNVIADATGKWSLALTAGQVKDLGEGAITLTANATDHAGNASAAVNHPFVIDSIAPVLTIDNVTADNILNAAETASGFTFTGTSDANQAVTVTLNGIDHNVTADANGKWSLVLTAAEVIALGQGSISLTANGIDAAGNASAEVSHPFVIDTLAPALTIDNVTADDILNAAESKTGFTFTGTSDANQVVIVTLNGQEHSVTADVTGKWSLALTAGQVKDLGEGAITLTANATDHAGNASAAVNHPFVIDSIAPVLTIDNVTADNILNATETASGFTFTGTSDANQAVTVTLNGIDHNVTADANGKWSLVLTAAEVIALGQGSISLTANAIDAAGNASAEVSHPFVIDTLAPALTIDNVTADDILNAAESKTGFTFTGTSDANQVVIVTLNGQEHSVTADATGKWSLVLTAGQVKDLGEGDITLTANATDTAGNASTTVNHPFAIDSIAPVLTIDNVTADNILNATETASGFTFTGTSDANQAVTVTLNGIDHNVTADANGKWSLVLTAAEVIALGQGSISLTANATDLAGNASVEVSHPFVIDTLAPVLTIDNATADDILNAAESKTGFTLTGTSDANQVVIVTLNGQDHSVTADATGKWSLVLTTGQVKDLGEGNITLTANATDTAGNASVEVSHPFVVDTLAPIVTIDPIAVDNMLNNEEAKATLTISGTSNAEAGQVLTVTLNNKTYTATVNSDGTWTLDVPAADVTLLPEGHLVVTAGVADKAGNVSTTVESTLLVDLTPPTITIDVAAIAGDGVVNIAEAKADITISGTANDAKGQVITVTLNAQEYSATVDALGHWTVTVPKADVANLIDGNYAITATVKDAAGNIGSLTTAADQGLTVDLTPPTITFNTISSDNVLSVDEATADLVISGNAIGADGQVISIILNGSIYNATVAIGGAWTVTVDKADVAKLPQGNVVIAATVSDVAGNPIAESVKTTLVVDKTPAIGTIDNVTEDNVINATEAGAGVAVTGLATGMEGQELTVTFNNQTFTTTVGSDGKWVVNIDTTTLSALTDGKYTITAGVKNASGVLVTIASHEVGVDTTPPIVTINSVTADNIVNAAEANVGIVLSGTVSVTEAGQPVTITLGGKTYITVADKDGNWSLDILPTNIKALADGQVDFTVTVTDKAGNISTEGTTGSFMLDATVPVVKIDTVSDDNILSATEVAATITISGTVTGAAAGDTVAVMINGVPYAGTVTVNLDGSTWSLTLPANSLTVNSVITATVTDQAGNSSVPAESTLIVDTGIPVVTINTVSDDNLLNAAEVAGKIVISGTAINVEAGQILTISIDGVPYPQTVKVDGAGKWSFELAAGALTADTVITATVSDIAGNTSNTASSTLIVDMIKPVVVIDTVSVDDILNATEVAAVQTITGSVTGAEPGDIVIITINGTPLSGTVNIDANGKWSFDLPANTLTGNSIITASVTDKAGNVSDTTIKNLVVDTIAPMVTIDPVSIDNMLNASEVNSAVTISGSTIGAEVNQDVIVMVGSTQYTAKVAANGKWSLTLPAGTLTADTIVTAVVKDIAGNESNTATSNLVVDQTAPVITFDKITGDDIVNAAEAGKGFTLSGRVDNLADKGQVITITLNGKEYVTLVKADGTWSINVIAADVAAIADATNVSFNAEVSDIAGNKGTATGSFELDTVAPTIVIDDLSYELADGSFVTNVINQPEVTKQIDGFANLVLTGTAVSAESVTVTLGGVNAIVTFDAATGIWQAQLTNAQLEALAQGKIELVVTATDKAGNSATSSTELMVDTQVDNVHVNLISGDNGAINLTEHATGLIVTGTAEAGSSVNLNWAGGTTSTVIVGADGHWSMTLTPTQLSMMVSEGQMTVSIIDKNGNEQDVILPLSTTTSATVNITGMTGTDIDSATPTDTTLNAADQSADVTVNGTASVPDGQVVTMTFDGRTYQTTVTNGTWSIAIPSKDFNGLKDGLQTIKVTVQDPSGNQYSHQQEVTIENALPPLTIDSFTGDKLVNIADTATAQVVTGTTEKGATVTVTIGGNPPKTIVADNTGKWSLVVTEAEMKALVTGSLVINAEVTGASGNQNSATQTVIVDVTAPDAVMTIDSITNDTGASVSDFITSDKNFAINGSLDKALGAGEKAQISLDGGATWIDVVLQAGNKWTYNSNNSITWSEGKNSLLMHVIDGAGNASLATEKIITLDSTAPDQIITVTNITDDTGNGLLGADSDFITADNTPTLHGTLSKTLLAGEVLQIRLGSGEWITVTVDSATNSWQFAVTTALADGEYNYQLRVLDIAGNAGAIVSKEITIDTTAVTDMEVTLAITQYTDNVGTNTGHYPSATETDDTTPLLQGTITGTGTLQATDRIAIYMDGNATPVGYATVVGSTWSLQLVGLAEGSHKFTAKVIDLAGNISNASAEFEIIVDTTAPAETATIVSYTDDVGIFMGDFISNTDTDDQNITLNGTLSAPIKATDVVRVYEGTTLLGTATVTGTTWTFNLTNLSESQHTYHVVVADAAGNQGNQSNDFVVNVDITAPTSIITVDQKLTADTTPLITGTITNLQAGESVWVKINGIIYRENDSTNPGLNVNRVTGRWEVQISAANALNVDGNINQIYDVDARITDKAGNFKETTSSDQLTVYADTEIIRSPSFDYMAETQPAFIIKGAIASGETMVVEIYNQAGTLIKTFTSAAGGGLVATEGGGYSIASSAWGANKLAAGKYSIKSKVSVADGSGGQISSIENFTVVEPVTQQNVTNPNDDSASRVFATSDGGYWLFWATGQTATGTSYDLKAQRYDNNGLAIGSIVDVASRTGQDNQVSHQYIRLYDVYMKADDSFSVNYFVTAQTPFLQNFNADGSKVGAAIALNNALDYELTPVYVNMADGGYALLYCSGTLNVYNVYAIRYNADGTPRDTAPLALTTTTTGDNGFSYHLGYFVGSMPTGTGTSYISATQGLASVDIGDGKFAMMYMSRTDATGGTDMYMKVFDFATGQEVGTRIRAATLTDKMEIGAELIALKGGGFVAVWASNTGSVGTNGTMDGFDVYSRRFEWDAVTQKIVALDANENRVNTTTDGVNGVAFTTLNVNLGVTALEQGGYVVVWSKFTAANMADVYAQSYDAAGNKLGGETLISTDNPNLDTLPSVTALMDGGYVVSWDAMTTNVNYWNGLKNDIHSVIVNADGSIRGKGDSGNHATAQYLDGTGVLTGGDGVNTLDGRKGATELNGGKDNDYLIVTNINTKVNGGAGYDTMIWDSADNLVLSDMIALGNFKGIEAIHLGDSYQNNLTVTLQDVLDASDTTDVLVIQGGNTGNGTADNVTLGDSGWYLMGNQIWRGETYQVFLNGNDNKASLWVQQGILVTDSSSQMFSSDSIGRLNGSVESDTIVMDNHEVVNIGNGGHDNLLYKLLDSVDAAGGNIHSTVDGFTVGSWENTADTDRIDLSSLLQGTGYTGVATASYVNGVATLDSKAGNIEDFINVRVENGNTVISIDRDGSGGQYSSTDLVTVSGVQTDLATLLANHQLVII